MSEPRWHAWSRLANDEKAARIYDALLDVRDLTPTEIADRLQVARTTLYPSLEWLKRQGLVLVSEQGRETRYSAMPPHAWRLLAEQKRAQAEGVFHDLEVQLPGWMSAYEAAHRPRVRALEGEDGLRRLREEAFELGGEVWEYFAVDDTLRAQAKIEEAKRVQYTSGFTKGRSLIVLQRPDDAPPFFDRRAWDVRWLSAASAPFAGSLVIIESRVYLVASRQECMGLVIESPDVALLIRSLYERAWASAQPWTPPPGWERTLG